MEFQAATVTYILFSEQNNHPLSNITLKSNGFPKNDNMIQLFTSINQIFIIRIFSLQDQQVFFGIVIDPLQGCFIINDHSGNFPIINHALLSDENNITIINSGPDHAITFCS